MTMPFYQSIKNKGLRFFIGRVFEIHNNLDCFERTTFLICCGCNTVEIGLNLAYAVVYLNTKLKC